MKILVNKQQLLDSIIYAVNEAESDEHFLTGEDAINFIVKIENIVKKLPYNLTLGTLSKVMEEALE
jgi:hypothetical protein